MRIGTCPRFEFRQQGYCLVNFVRVIFALAISNTAVAQHVDFMRQIRPLLADHCLTCHGPDAAQRKADLRLDLKNEATRKKLIVPGEPSSSMLIKRVTTGDPDERMPPREIGKSLSAEQIDLLRRWIEQGAQWPEHWAFMPIIPKSLPRIASTWTRNVIDSFILKEIDRANLNPSPQADHWTLLRRMHLDLTGLPPSVQDIRDFECNFRENPDAALDRELDRLLASPKYGERMALDWLDLARFGDTNGYQDDALRPAWLYRDHVIAAFNADQPFDEFTVEQLAGDLLPDATLPQRIASGFNRLHRQNEEGGSDPEEFRVIYAVDRTNTTATTWMGLTMGCAQCHDHKYDPISQLEYYRLLAFFNSLKGENILVKNPRNNPPQILVPDEQQARQLAAMQGQQEALEKQIACDEPRVGAAFEQWLLEADANPQKAIADRVLVSSAGGAIGPNARRTYFADTQLEQNISLENPIEASGTLNVFRAGKHSVRIGHFSREPTTTQQLVGLVVGEGGNLWARIVLPSGKVVSSDSITLKTGTEYRWSYAWNPEAGELRLETREAGGTERNRLAFVDPALRAEPLRLDAFGLTSESDLSDESVAELYVDSVEYSAAVGKKRSESFEVDTQWTFYGPANSGSPLGIAKGISTADSPFASGKSILETLAVAPGRRSDQQRLELRTFFTNKIDPGHSKLIAEVDKLKKSRAQLESMLPQALVWEEQSPPRVTHVLRRGDFQQPGEEVTRGAPSIFRPLAAREPGRTADRLDLARWLVDPDHPLTPRVAMNRMWKQCFGHGLVRTMEDFGTQGQPPTHPELLDWLSASFANSGWDVKRAQRQMLQSATYRQSSNATSEATRSDAANGYWARAARRRLAAEEIRDVALAASGLLQTQIGGPSVFPRQPQGFYQDKSQDWSWPEAVGPSLYRRGLYTFYRRTTLYPSLAAFDAPQRGECTVDRPRTNTPLQALVTLNDPVFVEAACAFARRILDEGGSDTLDRMTFAFRAMLTRPPRPEELQLLIEHFETSFARYRADEAAASALLKVGSLEPAANHSPAELAAWTVLCNTLLNLDEAITRE